MKTIKQTDSLSTKQNGNVRRAAETRGRLLQVARALFARDGYAGTATERILAETGVKRGALYHHFRDKADLFEAVCVEMHREGVSAIEAAVAAAPAGQPLAALQAGCLAWMDHMIRPDVRRVLAIEAPSVLGWARWNELDREHGFRLLARGVQAASPDGAAEPEEMPLTILLNGAMNAAVIWSGAADNARRAAAMKQAVSDLLRQIFADRAKG